MLLSYRGNIEVEWQLKSGHTNKRYQNQGLQHEHML